MAPSGTRNLAAALERQALMDLEILAHETAFLDRRGASRCACRCLDDTWPSRRRPARPRASSSSVGRPATRKRSYGSPGDSGWAEISTRVGPTPVVINIWRIRYSDQGDADQHEGHDEQRRQHPIGFAARKLLMAITTKITTMPFHTTQAGAGGKQRPAGVRGDSAADRPASCRDCWSNWRRSARWESSGSLGLDLEQVQLGGALGQQRAPLGRGVPMQQRVNQPAAADDHERQRDQQRAGTASRCSRAPAPRDADRSGRTSKDIPGRLRTGRGSPARPDDRPSGAA